MAGQIIFSDEARSDLRSIDRETALRLLHGLVRYVATEAGDVKQLQGHEPPQFRLRIGNCRIRFHKVVDGDFRILRVLHRSEAYR